MIIFGPQITDKQYTYNTFSIKSLLLSIAISLFCFYSNAGTRIVTNTNDTGTGSLRAEIDSAQEGDTIRFSSSLIASEFAGKAEPGIVAKPSKPPDPILQTQY